jgi:hypothetical protein
MPRADALTAVSKRLEAGARQVLAAERALVDRSRQVEVQTRDLLADGRRLTEVGERIDTSLGAFRAALPRLLEGLDTVEELEERWRPSPTRSSRSRARPSAWGGPRSACRESTRDWPRPGRRSLPRAL